MARKIDSEQEYERRKRLLKKQVERERKILRRQVVKTILPTPDVSEVVERIIDITDS